MRYPILDALRFAFAIWVVMGHFGWEKETRGSHTKKKDGHGDISVVAATGERHLLRTVHGTGRLSPTMAE